MKFKETIFDEYIQSNKACNLHPRLRPVIDALPSSLNDMPNIIIHGPIGTGKYTQSLILINKYSATSLKYEKKMSLQITKQTCNIKLSDIHYEVDFSLLGCNSRVVWHDIYLQIVDSISAKNVKIGIILCKNFHTINGELLDIFYSYMQHNKNGVTVKYIFISEQVSFMPNNIVDSCKLIPVARPTKTNYAKCSKTKMTNIMLSRITNVKCLGENKLNHVFYCDRLIDLIKNANAIRYVQVRDFLYDMLIMNLDIMECIWYILKTLILDSSIKESQVSSILMKTYIMLQRYNNNYRPIMHLESFIFTLINAIHGYSYSPNNITASAQ